MELYGKVALITGASRGIGRGIAIELSKCGAIIAINFKEDESGAKETQKLVKNIGGTAEIFNGDVSNYQETSIMIQNVIKKFGKIDILVNNAGISKVGIFIDMNEEEWDKIINTNLKGTINCTHIVLKHMSSKKSGVIINISSMWGNIGASCEAIYSASKGAINSFTKSLAKEMGGSGIRVNAIAPGVIETDMNKWLSEDERQELVNDIPLLSFGDTSDIGRCVAFLASDDSKYITGQIITIDGGMN